MTLTQKREKQNEKYYKKINEKRRNFYPFSQVFVHTEGNISLQRQRQTFKQRTGMDSFVAQPKIFVVAERKELAFKGTKHI